MCIRDSGDVGLFADAGSITDGGTTEADVTATSVILSATGSIGASGNSLDLVVTNLAAESSTSGDIFLSDTGGMNIGSVTVGATNVVGVTTTASDIEITDTNTININSPVDADSNGDVTIETTAGTGNIVLNDDVRSSNAGTGDGSGVITLDANGSILDGTAGRIEASAGDVRLIAGTSVGATGGGRILTLVGDIAAVASGAVSYTHLTLPTKRIV